MISYSSIFRIIAPHAEMKLDENRTNLYCKCIGMRRLTIDSFRERNWYILKFCVYLWTLVVFASSSQKSSVSVDYESWICQSSYNLLFPPRILVIYFGGQSLDMDLDFWRYWHFYCTIINVITDRNPYKRGATH